MANKVPLRAAPLSHQVLDILVEQIRDGSYPPGSQLPPEHELAEMFDVSRATVRSAMSALAARGLVVKRHGVGTFVSRLSRISNPINEATDFYDLITRQGYSFGVQFVHGEFAQPENDVAEALEIDPEGQVLRTHKVFTADDDPVIYCINCIPRWVFGNGLVETVDAKPELTEPLYSFMEERCGQRTEYHIARFRSDTAENCDTPGLILEPGTPVLVMEEVGYNAQERPLWHSFVYFPGNFFTFEAIRRRGPGR
jgi:GntR family transcriptional regulator